MKNPNRQGFFNHVDTIRRVESDKDAFLKAARLERHESRREPLKASDIIKLAGILGGAAVLCTVLVLGYLSGHFIPALFGVAFIGLFGGALLAGN